MPITFQAEIIKVKKVNSARIYAFDRFLVTVTTVGKNKFTFLLFS